MGLSRKEMKLVVGFLDEYYERLTCDGCNDWNFPDDWTEGEQEAVRRELFSRNNSCGETLEDFAHPGNQQIVELLRDKLKESLDG